MINHIDLSSVLRRTVCEVYSDLVTRPTGAAVRTQIERQLADVSGRTLTVIDFSHVGLLDFSCADEVVAKLLLRCEAASPPRELFFVVRGVNDSHLDAIETVLERHGLALVVEVHSGAPALVGSVEENARRIWEALIHQPARPLRSIAEDLGFSIDEVHVLVDELCRRRLVMRLDDGYVAVGAGT